MSDETPTPPTVVNLSDRRKARSKPDDNEFPFDLAERLKRRAETAEATANASKQMLDHVRRAGGSRRPRLPDTRTGTSARVGLGPGQLLVELGDRVAGSAHPIITGSPQIFAHRQNRRRL